MTTLHIGAAAADSADATRLADRLQVAGFTTRILLRPPTDIAESVRGWRYELHRRLRSSDGAVLVLSRRATDSPWGFVEAALARSFGLPLFPVRVEPAVRLSVLADVQWVDLLEEEDEDEAMGRLVAGLRAAGLDPSTGYDWDPKRSPFPGLAAFAPEDAAVFFGREPETRRLLEMLRPTLIRTPGRLVAVVGPSGSGKSSLVRAGLLPRLAASADRWVIVAPFRPGAQPRRNVALALARTATGLDSVRLREEVLGRLNHEGPASAVRTILAGVADGARTARLLLVIDQAEELVTEAGPVDRRAFLHELKDMMKSDGRVWAVATLRSEFLSDDPDRADLTEAVDDALIVEPVGRARLGEIILGPARRAGLDLAPGLTERIIDDTVGGDALPLLAYTLRELAERAGAASGTITTAAYEAVGGVVGALRNRADQVVAELTSRGYGDHVLPTLCRLASITGDGEPTRRRVRRDTLDPDARVVVDAFVDAFLLTSTRASDSSSADDAEPAVRVDIAHEALLRQWPPLRAAIETDRDRLRLRSDLARAAADWRAARRDTSALLQGSRLGAYDTWTATELALLTLDERTYLLASRAAAARALSVARRANRRLRLLTVALIVLLLAATTAGVLASAATATAHTQTALATSRLLATEAGTLLPTSPTTAIVLGLQSLSLSADPAPSPVLVAALARTTHPSRQLPVEAAAQLSVVFDPTGHLVATGDADTISLWDAHTDQVRSVIRAGASGTAFSPDGTLLASTSGSGTVGLWDVSTGQPHGPPLTGHNGPVDGVAFTRDGAVLASAGEDGTVRLWRVATGQPAGPPLTGHTGAARTVAFSPDGTLLASGGDDGTVRLWDTATGRPHGRTLTAQAGPVFRVAFSPDGRLLASAHGDGTVRLWDRATGRSHGAPLTGNTTYVYGVAFSPDGRLIASAGGDHTVRLWDTVTGQPHGLPLIGHTNLVYDVAFSPDGKTLASAGADQAVRLWDTAETDFVGRALLGHVGIARAVAFSPDGRLLASAGDDGTIRLWDTATGAAHGLPLTGNTDAAIGVAFSPDGRLVASAGLDGDVRLWDTATGAAHGPPLVGHSYSVYAVAFSPDGKLLASGSADRTIRLWDVATGQPRGQPLTGRVLGTVFGLAFSSDGARLASASGDGSVQLWDVATGQQHGAPLVGHAGTVDDVAFSPDGRLVASAGADRTVRIWDAATGQPVGAPLSGNTAGVLGVAFSPDGRTLASAGGDQSIRLWDTGTWQPHGPVLSAEASAVYGVAFSPDGRLLASAAGDGTVRLWNTTAPDWVTAGCSVAGRNLTLAEWNQFVPQTPYERTCPDLPAGTGAPADAPAARHVRAP